MSNTHCVSEDVYACICLNWEQWWKTACPMLWGTCVSEDMYLSQLMPSCVT